MNIDIGINLLRAVATIACAISFIAWIGRKRTTRQQAFAEAWKAWREVSMASLAKGQPVPAPPHEPGKR